MTRARRSTGESLAPVIGEVVAANRYAEDHPAVALQSDGEVWVGAVQWDGLRDTVVRGELSAVRRQLDPADARRLDQYTTNIRELEQRIQRIEAQK